MLLHDFSGIAGLHVTVPNGFRIHDYNWTVLALVKTQRLVDADFGSEAGGFGQLLKLSEDLALSVRRAGGARCIGWANVMANKDMMFKLGQAVFLLGAA